MVDHKMRQMGETILYGENTWVLDLTYCCQPLYHPQVQTLLKYVRNLQIRVSTEDAGVPYYEAGQRWYRFIAAVKLHSLQRHQLSLSLIMLHPSNDQHDTTPISTTIQEGDEWIEHRFFAESVNDSFLISDWRPKDIFVRILRRHHIWGDGPRWLEDITVGASPLCDQRNFTLQEQEIERLMMDDETYCSDAKGKSKAIHEPGCDLTDYEPLPQGTVWLDWDISSWKSSSNGCPCSLCGPSNGVTCYKHLL